MALVALSDLFVQLHGGSQAWQVPAGQWGEIIAKGTLDVLGDIYALISPVFFLSNFFSL